MIEHLFFGTIFLIAPNTWMTADHVLNAPWVQYHATYYDVVEEERNELYDLATFKKESTAEPLNLECRPAIIGEEITVKGYPFRDGQYQYEELTGNVIAVDYQAYEGRNSIVVDIPVIGGFSGSPAIDTDGDVIGVVTDRTIEGEHYGFISSVCEIDKIKK